MSDSYNYISLSNNSIDAVRGICQAVKTRNSENEISVTMANGIADFVATNGQVSEKQALWIARNADFWKIARPDELTDIRWEAKKPPTALAHAPSDAFESEGKTLKAILEAVQRIERKQIAR